MAESFVEEHMRKTLARHELTQVKTEGPVKMFYLHEPGCEVADSGQLRGRMMSTLLVFTLEGIVIMGDLCPRACKRGCISDLGYGLDWFASELGEDYLCSKFLETGMYAEVLQRWLEDYGAHGEDVEKRALARELAAEAPSEDHDAVDYFFDALHQLGEEYDGQGAGYKTSDAGWLCAIQQRFSALYRAGQVRTAP